ncbi:unnamed protein product, partial [Oppiella nova]
MSARCCWDDTCAFGGRPGVKRDGECGSDAVIITGDVAVGVVSYYTVSGIVCGLMAHCCTYAIPLILIVFFVLLLLSLIPVIGGQGSSLPSLPNPPGGGGSKLSRCEQCQLLTDSFQAKLTHILFACMAPVFTLLGNWIGRLHTHIRQGVERTSRGKHEGGDSHWEESRLGSYANSEIRLTEIQELLCHELSAGKDQVLTHTYIPFHTPLVLSYHISTTIHSLIVSCHHLAEEYEPQIENWWFSKRQASDSQSLYDYLCMGQMKACCPTGHYGPQCQPCPGYPDRVCNTRGYCEGNGSREGTGKCVCQPAYDGAHCNTCAKDHWLNGTTAEGLVVCEPCDKSCADRCRSGGPKGCLVCGTGYIWDGDYGCVDVDECADMGVNPCESNAFCINTEG